MSCHKCFCKFTSRGVKNRRVGRCMGWDRVELGELGEARDWEMIRHRPAGSSLQPPETLRTSQRPDLAVRSHTQPSNCLVELTVLCKGTVDVTIKYLDTVSLHRCLENQGCVDTSTVCVLRNIVQRKFWKDIFLINCINKDTRKKSPQSNQLKIIHQLK